MEVGKCLGSGYNPVGRLVAFNTKGPKQTVATFIEHFFTAMAHLKKIYKSSSVKNSICNQVDSSSNLDSNKELDFYKKNSFIGFISFCI